MSAPDFKTFKDSLCSFKNVSDISALIKIDNAGDYDFEGFDANHLANIIFNKCSGEYKHVAEAVCIGYKRGNIHEVSLKRTGDKGKAKITACATLFGIKIGAKGVKRSLDRDTLTFTRIMAVFPQVVGHMLHLGHSNGGFPARDIPDRGYGVNSLPSPMRFLHFISCAGSVTDEAVRKNLVAASAAWVECFLFQIVADKKTVTDDMVSRQLTTMSSQVMISNKVSSLLLEEWGVTDKGVLDAKVISVAKAYLKAKGKTSE